MMIYQNNDKKEATVKSKIFISWSGENSKAIAKALKKTLEDNIFKGTGLSCFVSDEDICSGDDWYNKIKKELNACKLGIVCITKENIKAPWIYFESGSLVARNLTVIPLLISCDGSILDKTPLSNKHRVDFDVPDKFIKMILDINNVLNLTLIGNEHLAIITEQCYKNLTNEMETIIKKLNAMRVLSTRDTYPQRINAVIRNTIYISAPMASLEVKAYKEIREFLLELEPKLKGLGFERIVCPSFDKPSIESFDGSTKAILDNYAELKRADAMIAIYPKAQPTSTLIEIGYGIALCKRMVIFYYEKLPYMLEDAGLIIPHVSVSHYDEYTDIMRIIDTNGMQLFKLGGSDS